MNKWLQQIGQIEKKRKITDNDEIKTLVRK